MKIYLMTPKYNTEFEISPTWNLFGLIYENNKKILIWDVAFLFFFRFSVIVKKYMTRKADAR